LHGYSAANFGRLAAHKAGIPAVMHEHAVLKVLPHQYVMDWLLRNRTSVAVGVSASVKEFLIRGRSVPPHKARVIWNGVNFDSFQSVDLARIQAFRQQFGIAGEQQVIGTVTRLHEEKGNRYFIEAASLVLREFPNARFIIVGDGPLRQELEAAAKNFDLGGKLHFAGFISDVAVAYAAMDIFVMASLTEGFGLALAEAMAAGKPAAATKVGGMKEMIEHEQNGLLVPPANSMALAAAMIQLLKSPVLQKQLGNAARRRSQDFSLDRNVKALEALYTEMLASGNGQA
jgi:glycosyltransferase involved in cell wall biosynthesis